jgi:AGCS family alanine or glycine:cation symporter
VLFKQINEAVNSFVWGVPMLALIIGAGVYLSFRTGFIQIFKFGFAMKNTFGKAFKKQKVEAGAVTPFQAMTTALAATVGTANIAGVTSAVTLGGAGALFWMWVSALIGMCTKYAEVVLAMRFRERNKAGEWVGGPMYYIKNGLGGRYRWLADAFCIFGAVAALGSGNAVQVGNMTGSINRTVVAFIPSASGKEGTISLVIGLVVAVLTALTLFGGVKRIGRVTEMIVPFMAVVYITAALAGIIAQ